MASRRNSKTPGIICLGSARSEATRSGLVSLLYLPASNDCKPLAEYTVCSVVGSLPSASPSSTTTSELFDQGQVSDAIAIQIDR